MCGRGGLTFGWGQGGVGDGGGNNNLMVGNFSRWGRMSKFLAEGGTRGTPAPYPPSIENPVMCYFLVYMIRHSCLYDSAKTACFE